MLKQLKNCLSRIKISKLSIILIFLFAAFLLFMPIQSIRAIGFADVWTYFDTALGGIEEITGPVNLFFIIIILLTLISLGFLTISAYLLQWVINFPIYIMGNPFVEQGWSFVLSLANLCFILFFVYIALSFILKHDTLKTKKTLIKLIQIALLTNFSLVFVSALCDIARFFYNTALMGSTDFAIESIRGLTGGTEGIIADLTGKVTLWLVAYSLPLVSHLKQISTVTLLFSIGSAPTIIAWIVQIFFNFAVGGVFYLYFFVFFSRIFVIWILAILSPLAFACYILEETKGKWDEWWKHLTQWLFFGIFALFYLILGLKLLPMALPRNVSMLIPILGPFLNIGKMLVYYSAMFVYLSIGVGYLATQGMPDLWKPMSKMAGQIKKIATPLVTKPIKRAYRGWIVGEEKVREEREKRLAEGKRVGTLENLFGGASRVLTTPGRWAYRVARISPKESQSKDIKKMEENIKNRFGDDYVGAANTFNQLGPIGKAALVHHLQAIKGKGRKALDALKPEQLEKSVMYLQDFEPDWIKDIAKYKPELLDKDLKNPRGVGNIVRQALVSKGKDDNYVKELVGLGIEEPKAIRKAAMKAAIGKPDDIIDYSDEILKDPDFHEAILLKSNYQQYIRKAGEKGGQPVINEIRKTYDAMLKDEKFGARFFEKNNRGILYNRNATFMSIWPPVNEINGYNVRGSLGKGKPPRMSVYVEIEKTLHENSALAGIDKIYTKIDELEQQMQNSRKQILNSEKRGISAISSAQIKQSNEKIEEASKEIKEATGIIKQGFKNNPALKEEWKHIKGLKNQLEEKLDDKPIKELKNQLKEKLDDKPKKNKKKEKLDDKPKKNKK